MVPLWFTLSALCFVGAAVLLYVDIDRRRGLGRRRKSWAKSHGFDYEYESEDLLKRWKRGVMSTVGDVTAKNVVLGQIRGEAVFIFDIEEVATVIALHRKVGTNVVVDLRLKGLKEPRENDIWLLGAIGPRMVYSTNLDAARRACDRRMVTFAHTAPDCAEIMWNEQNWTLVAMPVTSNRAQWDEGLRTVRQFNDLLRVLPPVPNMFSYTQDTIDESVNRFIDGTSGPLRDMMSQGNNADNLKALFRDTQASSEAVVNGAALEKIDEIAKNASVLISVWVTVTDIDGVNAPTKPYRLRVIVHEDDNGHMTGYDLKYPDGGN